MDILDLIDTQNKFKISASKDAVEIIISNDKYRIKFSDKEKVIDSEFCNDLNHTS